MSKRQEDARHRDAHFLTARERSDVAVDPRVVEAEAVKHLARAGLELVPPALLVLLLDFAESRQDAVHRVGRRRVAHPPLEVDQLVMQVAQPAASRDRLVEDRAPGHRLGVLTEVADRDPLGHGDLSGIRRLLTREHPEQRRLPGPVRADETDFLPGIQLEGRIDEDDAPPVLLGDARHRDHAAHTLAAPRQWRSLVRKVNLPL